MKLHLRNKVLQLRGTLSVIAVVPICPIGPCGEVQLWNAFF